MDDWSVKDILACLVDWEQRFISWYQVGLRSEGPETPTPGITWRDLPKINQEGFERHKDETLKYVLDQSGHSYQEFYAHIEGMAEHEIFIPKYYGWIGVSSLLP